MFETTVEDVIIIDSNDILNTIALGVAVPLCLRAGAMVARPAPGALLACCLLLACDFGIESILGDDFSRTYHFLRASGKIMLLTAIGEYLSDFGTRACARVDRAPRVTTSYDCVATLLIGFVAFAQVVDAVHTIMGTQFDSATFLGLLLAGFTYAIRDSLACLLAGLQEIISPRYHIGDRIEVDGVTGELRGKSLASLQLRDNHGRIVTVPARALSRGAVTRYPPEAKSVDEPGREVNTEAATQRRKRVADGPLCG